MESENSVEEEREYLASFISTHADMYQRVAQALGDAVEADDSKALCCHIACLERCVQEAITLQSILRKASGNA